MDATPPSAATRTPASVAGVGGHLQAGPGGLGDQHLHVVDRVEVRLIVDDDLDHLGAEEDVLPDRLAHLLRGVGVEVLGLAEVGTLRLQAVELPAQRGDDPARR